MSYWQAIAAGGDATASLINTGVNAGLQDKWNRINIDREDTAVRRRVADLKAAGLNPILAAGQPAQASQNVAPMSNIDMHMGEAMTNILSGALMEAQIDGKAIENSQLQQELEERARNIQYYKSKGLPSDGTQNWAHDLMQLSELAKSGGLTTAVANIIRGGIDAVKEGVKTSIDELTPKVNTNKILQWAKDAKQKFDNYINRNGAKKALKQSQQQSQPSSGKGGSNTSRSGQGGKY